MIYPQNFEQKTGFDKVRRLISEKCLSPLGEERVAEMEFSADYQTVTRRLEQNWRVCSYPARRRRVSRQLFFWCALFVEADTPRRNLARWKRAIRPETFAPDNQRYYPLLSPFPGRGRRDQIPGIDRPCRRYQVFPQLIGKIDAILDKFGRVKGRMPLLHWRR